MNLSFIKACALGNDFVMFEGTQVSTNDLSKLSQKLADRRYGVGCDQVIIWEPVSSSPNVFKIRFFNQDGSEAETCGNGTRSIALWIMDEFSLGSVSLQTLGGNLVCQKSSFDQDWIDVTYPAPKVVTKISDEAVYVNLGNPHLVLFKEVDLLEEGIYWRTWLFDQDQSFPPLVNVGCACVESKDHLKLQVYERGTGVTPACGSGACAAVIAASLLGKVQQKVRASQEGGDLFILWDHSRIILSGGAQIVFRGEVEIQSS